MASGIKELANIIEKIKKKKLSSAIIEYQEYSKFPELKSKKYIEALEERILKGEIDIGNISDKELELFNQQPTLDDINQLMKEKKENKKGCFMFIGLAALLILAANFSDIYDYFSGPQVEEASSYFYSVLSDEMEEGNTLGNKIFIVQSKHHNNVAYMAGMVFTPNNKDGIACIWAKTGGTDPMEGLWYSLNSYSKYFPYNHRFSKYECCAQAVKKHVEDFYSKK